ncbi:MAG: glycosyl hydrolase 115 family protein, partial [Acetatifactor sp.]|nr:glycosyl hydrolase 115 family protein [Acetatifactor sp.]
MRLVNDGQAVSLIVETEAFEGVKRIADKVAEDIRKVTGSRPQVLEKLGADQRRAVLCATLGKSALADALERAGLLDTVGLQGKREVYLIQKFTAKQLETVETLSGLDEWPQQELLLICGSDKRGTIYGMFALSEYIGVSPLCFWGDVEPAQKPDVEIGDDIQTLSKEPSVRYRGFFINDEWPCFGNWTSKHFGGFNADAYEHVFELLLRLKGNYLWPAMWSASFPIDGPGSANEELADIYGVVMGYSHHEPCLRASEEWDKVRGPETKYGNEWNFYTNEQGLLNYWKEALERSGKYENIITIGMRGERDTSMLGEQATVEENVNLLKDIIRKQ